MIKTKAAVATGDGQFEIREIEVAAPGAGEILVKIKASGVCHTDYDSMSWGKPLVMGHEGAGTVAAVGEGVENFEAGQSVVLNWAVPCGECFQCGIGNRHICEENSFVTGTLKGHAHEGGTCCRGADIKRSFHLGTMAGYALVKAEAVTALNSTIPYASAAIIGCGVMTGFGSAVNAARVSSGSSAAVLGCGGVGLNVIQGCKYAGAATIIAIDVSSERLEMAKSFGATHTVLADPADREFIEMRAAVVELTGRGADFAFECTAIPELGAAPLALLRNAGTAIQASGIEQKILFDCELFEWDKIYLNPLYGQCDPQRDFPLIQQLYLDKKIKLDELVTKTYRLEELATVFEDMMAGRIAKGVIVFDEEEA